MNNEKSINTVWADFKVTFWIIFLLKIGLSLLLRSPNPDLPEYVMWFLFYGQLVTIISMAITMGLYSYRLLGKKHAWLNGLLGLFWFGEIGIFIGYIAVKRIRDFKLKSILLHPSL